MTDCTASVVKGKKVTLKNSCLDYLNLCVCMHVYITGMIQIKKELFIFHVILFSTYYDELTQKIVENFCFHIMEFLTLNTYYM